MDTSHSIRTSSASHRKVRPARGTQWLVQSVVVLIFWLVAGTATAQTYPDPLLNTAQVTVPGNIGDPDTGNNTATDSNALAATADLSVTKSLLTASPVPAGGSVSYQIVVSNAGPSAAVDATVVDTVPVQLTNVSWTCTPGSAASSCGATSGTGNVNTVVTVAPGDTITIVVTGTAPASGTVDANTVTITPPPGTTDPDPGNNTGTTPPVPVAPVSNLSLAKTLTSASPAPAGSIVTYQIVVSNAGPSDAIGATITDTVPPQLTNVSWTCVAAGTSTCGTASGTGNTISLSANIAAGGGNTITITVTGTAPASGTIGANTATVTPPPGTTDPVPGDNTDTEPEVPVTPIVSINSASAAEGDAVVFTVSLSGASATPVTVTLDTADGTATAGADYTAQTALTVTIPAGNTSATVSVPTLEDVVFEGDETFTATISNPSGATIGTATGTGTITEDDAQPTVSINSASAAEGDAVVFTVSLSNPTTSAVTVTLDTTDNTATAGVDYTAQVALTVTIAAGSTSTTVSIPTIEDTIFEGDETFTATISNPTGATIGTAAGTGTISDDDATPTLSINDVTVDESAGTAVFTVTLSGASATPVTVDYASANGSALAGSDYTATSGTLTFAPGVLTQTISVPIIDDAIFEGNETYTVALSNPTVATIADGSGLGTITDNETTPVVSIDSPSAPEGDTMVFTVSLSNPSASDVTVTLDTANGTAVAPGDYTAQTALTVTILAGSTSTVVNVPTIEDTLFEGNETFTATISSPIGATIGTGTGTATITEDDAQPTVSIDSPTAAEGDTMVFTVSLSAPSATDVTVTLNTANGTAVAPGDYTAQSAITVTVPAGSTSTTVNVPTIEDMLFEGNETFTATISNPVGATTGTATGTATITEDDAQPTVSINGASATEGSPVAFTVSLSGASATDVTVVLDTANGTAVAPGDYTAQTALTVTIPAGSTSATVNVPTLDDALFEGDETFTATISNPVGATLGTATGTGTITDNEAMPVVSIAGASATEGSAVPLTVSLSNPSATDVTVTLNTADGTATAPADYTAQTALTVTIPAGSTSATVNVPTVDDALFEGDETFNAAISNPSGATLGTATAVGTITENDAAPTLSINDVSVNEAAGTATFTVTLSGPSANTVTVDYASSAGTATSPADFAAVSGSLGFAPGVLTQAIAVAIVNDNIDEADETYTIGLANAAGATIADGSGLGTIVDDEGTPTVSIDSPTATEGDTMVFTVSLSNPSASDVTVTLNTANGTATAPADYTAQSAITVTILAGSTSTTVNVPTIEDALFEGDENFTATISNPAGATIGTGTGTATITEDDAQPTVSIDSPTAAEGDTMVFTVSLSAPSATDVTVTLNTANGTAVAPGDYTAQSATTVTIPAGSTSATVNVPTIEDTLFEGDETFTATISNPVGATLGTATGTATITEDDAQPTVSIDSPTAAEGDTMVFTVSLSAPSATDVTVTLNTANGTAIAPGDYTAQSAITVTIPAGSTSATVNVPTIEDTLFEGNETFTATIGNPVGATLGTATGTATITEDDTQPTVSINSASAAEGDAVAFTVSLSAPSATDVTVTLNTANGTAVAPGDYTAQTAVIVTIPAGSTSATVNVPTIEDTLFEGDEAFTATISNPAGATLGTATGTGTITEDDAQPTVSIDSPTATEGDPMVFTVSLSNPSASDVTVVFNTADGTAAAPGDYTAQTAVIVTIPAGSTSATVNVPTIEDTLFEGNETFTATISAPVGAALGTATGTATITEDDAQPTVSINSASAAEGDAVVFTVSLSSASATDVTVTLATADASAIAGTDYTAQAGVTVTVPAGSTSTTASVPTIEDALFEGDETFTATIGNPTGATLGTATGTGTITDDEAAPAISINDVTVNEAAGTATFTATLGSASSAPVTVDYATANGTATAGSDYTATSGTLTFAPGVLTQTISVAITSDNIDEADETFTVNLANAAGATIADNSGQGTIVDDEATPTLAIADGTAVEGSPVELVVSLSGPSATDVTVILTTTDGTATAPADYTAQAGITVTIPAGQTSVTVPVPTATDGVYEGDETFAAALSNPVGATLGDANAAATITDAQQPVVATPDTGSIGGANGGTAVPNVLANDSVGGSTATPSTVTLTQVSSTHPNITLDTGTGAVNVAPGTPAGDYTLTYQICEIASPANCATATVTVTVTPAAIAANDDAGTATSTGGNAVAMVLANDTLGGQAATTAGVILTQQASSHPGLTLDTATGAVNVAAGMPAGNYTLTYRICERLNPGNCDEATVTVVVTAATIVANDDNAGPVDGSTGGTAVTNVLDNDTLGGTPVNPADVTLIPGNAGPITINPDGTVDIAPNTPAGSYTAGYQICEIANPANCDGATITVIVAAAVIDAIDDGASATPVNGSNGGTAIGNVLANDTLGGTTPTTGNVQLSLVSSSNTGVTLDTGTGAVSVAANTVAGTHTLTYRICERLNPGNCDDAVATVAVSAAAIDAVNDNAGPVDGISGGTAVINVLGNDTLNGGTITPASVTLTSTPTGALTINTNGMLDVAPQTPSGTYTAAYRICQNLNPGNCDDATATVTVTGNQLALRLAMRALQRRVKAGDLVRYVVTAQNTGSATASNVNLVNSIPAGFSYVAGSLTVVDDDRVGSLAGARPLTVGALDLAPGREATVTYDLRVGAGVGPGTHTNSAVMQSTAGQPISNVASADVEVLSDPLLADSLILGTVFDDRNGNGIQEAGERGVPGVRIASIEGLISETDAFGRYHLEGIPGGSFSRGRLFILKVDPNTLPAGTTFTTENPRVRRITPGLPVRFDFGVKLPDGKLGCGRGQADIELGDVIFAQNSAEIPAESDAMLDRLSATVKEHCGGHITIVARANAEPLAFQRAQAVQAAVARRLDAELAGKTRIEITTEVEPLQPLVSLDRTIGLSALMFDTNKADVRPQYRALIRQIAQAINERGRGDLEISGYADARGSASYNQELGMRRAQAIFDAIATELEPHVRKRLRVDITTPNGAVAGVGSR